MSETTGATSEQIEAALDRWNPNWRDHDGTALVRDRRRLTERMAALIVPPGYRIIRADAALDAGRGVTLTEAEREACNAVASMAESHVNQFRRHWHTDNIVARQQAIDCVRALAASEPGEADS